MVCVDNVRNTKVRNKLVEENMRDCNCLLIRHCISFYVLGKVVNDSQNVPVTTLRAGQWVYNIYRDSLIRCSSVDRSEGTTDARVSLMPIACRTVFAPVLNVFGYLQPVEPLLYFFDCLLYTEVTTYSTSVSELEDLLPRGARDDCAKRGFGSFADRSAQAKNAVIDGKRVKTRPVVPQVLRFSLESFLSRALCFCAPDQKFCSYRVV